MHGARAETPAERAARPISTLPVGAALSDTSPIAQDEITFSFGENWQQFLAASSQEHLAAATRDIETWLGGESVAGRSVIDVGSGSGIHSLSFLSFSPARLVSFDYDENSVAATRSLWEKTGRPDHWEVIHGSVLDREFVASLGRFDIVYSWGVLHHTGAMWEALDNAATLVAPGGRLWISIYTKGPNYERDLALKRRYNAASALGKRWMVYRYIARPLLGMALRGKNPLAWFRMRERGMSPYYDVIDWLGGLPYEVASEDEILRFHRERGFELERIQALPEGGCSTYVFSRSPTG